MVSLTPFFVLVFVVYAIDAYVIIRLKKESLKTYEQLNSPRAIVFYSGKLKFVWWIMSGRFKSDVALTTVRFPLTLARTCWWVLAAASVYYFVTTIVAFRSAAA